MAVVGRLATAGAVLWLAMISQIPIPIKAPATARGIQSRKARTALRPAART